MRVLVCGGRDFTNAKLLDRILTAMHGFEPFSVVILGAARGADDLALAWADRQGVPVETYPANWQALGKAAGPIRNQAMIDHGKPELVIAFPTGGPGTEDMIRKAIASGLIVLDCQGGAS
jgi:hypothetical protein